MNVATHHKKLTTAIWDTPTKGRPFYVRWGLASLRLAVAVVRDAGDNNTSIRAGSLVYTTLLSLVPLLALCFSVLKGFGVYNQLEPFLQKVVEPMGAAGHDVVKRILEFVEHMQVGVLGAVGLAFLFYTVISLMQDIEAAFNDIWRVSEPRPVLVRIRDYLSVLFVGPVLMFLSVAMTTALRHSEAMGEGMYGVPEALVAWLLFAFAFAAIYMIMPYMKVNLAPAFLAGMLTGVIWKILGWLFVVFIASSSSYAAIYSAFATLVLLMIWAYIGWYVVLIGASICYYLQNPSAQRLSRRVRNFSHRVRETIALQICAAVGSGFYKHEPAFTTAKLAHHIEVSVVAVEDVVEDLEKSGIILRAGTKPKIILPACPLEMTSVEEMLSGLRKADENEGLPFDRLKPAQNVISVIALADQAWKKELGQITLKQLALGSASP